MKAELRKKYKELRRNINNKSFKDDCICSNFLKSDIYSEAKQIFCYYPLADEINTVRIISAALNDGKEVALPVCSDKNGNMDFYYIKCLDDISKGTFGIGEPIIEKCLSAVNYSAAVCIVPALTYDEKGFRLGYGKGYYDRFLDKFDSLSVGLCYNELLCSKLPCEEYDKSVDCICTEKYLIKL